MAANSCTSELLVRFFSSIGCIDAFVRMLALSTNCQHDSHFFPLPKQKGPPSPQTATTLFAVLFVQSGSCSLPTLPPQGPAKRRILLLILYALWLSVQDAFIPPYIWNRTFAAEHEAIEFGLARARMHIDAGQAARTQVGDKGKGVVVDESQGYVIGSVTAQHS